LGTTAFGENSGIQAVADVHKDIRLLKQNKSQKSQNPKGKGDIPFRTQTTHRRSRSLKSLCNTCHKLAAC